jgi:hypothetical protein
VSHPPDAPPVRAAMTRVPSARSSIGLHAPDGASHVGPPDPRRDHRADTRRNGRGCTHAWGPPSRTTGRHAARRHIGIQACGRCPVSDDFKKAGRRRICRGSWKAGRASGGIKACGMGVPLGPKGKREE